MRSESEEEKIPTAGFVEQNFPEKARELRHRQIRDKYSGNLHWLPLFVFSPL